MIILYQLTKFEAASFDSFQDIFNTSFQRRNLQRAIIKKNNLISPGNLVIFYQLTKSEVPSCDAYQNILITKFLIFNASLQCPNFQRAVTWKKK